MTRAKTDGEVRIALGLSKGAVARWAMVTDGTIARHEAGLGERSEGERRRIADVYAALRGLSAALARVGLAEALEDALGHPRGKAKVLP